MTGSFEFLKINLIGMTAEPMHPDGDKFGRAVIDIKIRIYLCKFDDLRVRKTCRIFDQLNKLARF